MKCVLCGRACISEAELWRRKFLDNLVRFAPWRQYAGTWLLRPVDSMAAGSRDEYGQHHVWLLKPLRHSRPHAPQIQLLQIEYSHTRAIDLEHDISRHGTGC